MIIIRFIIFAIFILFILFVIGVILFFSSVKNLFRSFNRMGNQRPQTSDRYNQQSSRKGQTITDYRTNEQRDKHIFAPDEGEYVDFEETKD